MTTKPTTKAVDALVTACEKYNFGKAASKEPRNDSVIMAYILAENLSAQGFTITRAEPVPKVEVPDGFKYTPAQQAVWDWWCEHQKAPPVCDDLNNLVWQLDKLKSEPSMSEASEADPMLIKVLNFIERCRDLQIISGGGKAVDTAAEREDLRTSADAIYKELEAVKWGVRTASAMSEAELELEAENLSVISRTNGVTLLMIKKMFVELAKKYRGQS